MKNIAIAVLGIVAALGALPSLAANATLRPIVVAQTGVADSAMTDGEVKKVDKDAGKLTIKHGPLTNLGYAGHDHGVSSEGPGNARSG